jgi:hypothetical protein
MENCTCSTTVRANWGTEKSQKGETCLFCNKTVKNELVSSISETKAAPTATPRKPAVAGPATLDDVVAAQNRTTHAIRAFVRFLFIQLSAVTAGVLLLNFANQASTSYDCVEYGSCGGSNALTIMAVLVIFAGVIISSNVGWAELRKSNIPD